MTCYIVVQNKLFWVSKFSCLVPGQGLTEICPLCRLSWGYRLGGNFRWCIAMLVYFAWSVSFGRDPKNSSLSVVPLHIYWIQHGIVNIRMHASRGHLIIWLLKQSSLKCQTLMLWEILARLMLGFLFCGIIYSSFHVCPYFRPAYGVLWSWTVWALKSWSCNIFFQSFVVYSLITEMGCWICLWMMPCCLPGRGQLWFQRVQYSELCDWSMEALLRGDLLSVRHWNTHGLGDLVIWIDVWQLFLSVKWQIEKDVRYNDSPVQCGSVAVNM
jgi:hypothetical protein